MAQERTSYHGRITLDPEIMVGKPVVTGTRIPVYIVLGFLAENPDLDELFAAYPRLTLDDVKACLAYAQHRIEPPARPRKCVLQAARQLHPTA